MRRLMTHLAQFSSFSKQGEVLSTRGLEYLLENTEARAAFAAYISTRVGVTVSHDLTWRAEVGQQDRARPDLEACATDGKPMVKVEAKLGAPFGKGQLQSYASDLQNRAGGGLLLVLVPLHRMNEANECVSAAIALDTANCRTTVLSWDEVLDELGSVPSDPFRCDLAQFKAMYRALNGDDIEPLPSSEAVRAWRERENVFVNYADRATRVLTGADKLLPMTFAKKNRTYHRYVCLPIGTQKPYFSIEVRDPFAGYDTPVWMRFHKVTPMFSIIRDRLRASGAPNRLVESGGHVWVPLDVPLNADVGSVVASLVEQSEQVLKVVRGQKSTA